MPEIQKLASKVFTTLYAQASTALPSDKLAWEHASATHFLVLLQTTVVCPPIHTTYTSVQ